ncbi:MAG: hypothetical protein Q7T15_07560 [Microcella sp.]|uniref:hypothetical protein n=1 Tax=Microcella sp. TaxID=1913979 RepID=UPI00272671D2|nr:hypothetical protein [Microcella sp.]MDO8338096.1 hypothetical protein [Microcella sp.]
MGKRITIEIVSILGISLAAAYAIMLGVVLAFGTALSDAFGEAARFLFGPLVAGIALWTLLVIVLAITLRRRGEGVRIAAHLGAALLAVLLNVALYAAIVPPGSGMEQLIVGIAAGAGAILLLGAIVGVVVTELVVLRPRGRTAAAR